MLSQGQVGPTAAGADGIQLPLRQGRLGDQIFSELHGRYYEACYRRNVFHAANTSAQSVSVALATTYTGLLLSNPLGSSVNLALQKVGLGLSAAPAAIAPLGILVGYNGSTNVTHSAPVTALRSSFVGVGAAPVGLVDSSATLPTAPTLAMLLQHGFTAAALPSSGPSLVDIEGSIILPPGAYAGIYALAAVTGLWSMSWEEVPV
jgi:hypothetical protein